MGIPLNRKVARSMIEHARKSEDLLSPTMLAKIAKKTGGKIPTSLDDMGKKDRAQAVAAIRKFRASQLTGAVQSR